MKAGKIRLRLTRGLMAVLLAGAAGAALAHGGEEHAPAAESAGKGSKAAVTSVAAAPQRLVDGSLFVPKAVQRQLELRTQIVRIGDLTASSELNGKVIADPATGGRVQASFAGSVVAGARGLPLPGRKVVKGEVLAWLRPVGGSIERGNQKAQRAELEAQLALAESRLRRYEQLEGVVPQKEIEAARIERQSLQKRRALVSASLDADEALRAPVSGVISALHVLAGQVVNAREVLFEIVDPDHLAVEALAYDASIGTALVSASALAGSESFALRFVGAGRQLREQALPLLFRVAGSPAALAVGQPVRVIVRTAQRIKGAALPRSALGKAANGEAVVWVHSEAERYTARRVRTQALDADSVAITDGLHDGERVVVAGGSLLMQVR